MGMVNLLCEFGVWESVLVSVMGMVFLLYCGFSVVKECLSNGDLAMSLGMCVCVRECLMSLGNGNNYVTWGV